MLITILITIKNGNGDHFLLFA